MMPCGEDPATPRVALFYHPAFLRHDTGHLHPECPERLEVILEALRASRWWDRLAHPVPEAARPEDLALVHEPAYIDLVRLACERRFTSIGSMDTRICAESHHAATLAAGAVLAACHGAVAGGPPRAFCPVRPPGHHAERDLAMGFCLFNNVAIGAESLIRRHDIDRVAIVDWDVHHGNGTQHAFEDRADVLYISLHERSGSLPFPGTGEEEETGQGAGTGATLNIPLVAGSGDEEYHRAFEDLVLPRLDDFGPEVILVSCGFDAIAGDSIANLRLEPDSYGWMTRELVGIADLHASGRLVSVLEGGYHLSALGRCAVAHVEALFETRF